MDLGGDGESAAGTYAARPWYAQVAVALAGPATHFLIAMVVLVATLGLASDDPFDGTAGASAVSEGSPAAMAGLEPGDVVVEIDGVPVASWQQVRSAASQRTTPLVGVTRDGAFVELSVPDFRGVILPAKDPVPGSGPAAVVVAAASQVVDLTGLTVRGLVSIVNNADDILGAAAGTQSIPEQRPVSIIGVADLSTRTGGSFGWLGVGVLIAQINIGLGLLNLLPFHPFDGGHAVAAVVNRVLRCRWLRRPVLRTMAALTFPVLAVLLLLFLASTVIDVRAIAM
jgi:regulator of sigma E protease